MFPDELLPVKIKKMINRKQAPAANGIVQQTAGLGKDNNNNNKANKPDMGAGVGGVGDDMVNKTLENGDIIRPSDIDVESMVAGARNDDDDEDEDEPEIKRMRRLKEGEEQAGPGGDIDGAEGAEEEEEDEAGAADSEVEAEQEIEEDNDYIESYFDNGEDYLVEEGGGEDGEDGPIY